MLEQLLFKRAREKGIAFNKDKCKCNKDRCLYYRMVFSKEEASADPAKVEVIRGGTSLQCQGTPFIPVYHAVQCTTCRKLCGRGLYTFYMRVHTFGIPEEIKSEHGPPSNGSKFSNVAQEQGFLHCKVTTAWAEANAEKEPQIARLERKPIRQEVKKTIGNYHAMPHPVTKQTLDQLMLGRELSRKLPESLVPTKEVVSGQIQR